MASYNESGPKVSCTGFDDALRRKLVDEISGDAEERLVAIDAVLETEAVIGSVDANTERNQLRVEADSSSDIESSAGLVREVADGDGGARCNADLNRFRRRRYLSAGLKRAGDQRDARQGGCKKRTLQNNSLLMEASGSGRSAAVRRSFQLPTRDPAWSHNASIGRGSVFRSNGLCRRDRFSFHRAFWCDRFVLHEVSRVDPLEALLARRLKGNQAGVPRTRQ